MAAKKKQNVVEETAEETAAKVENTFNKAQLLSTRRFAGRRDLLNALLDENKSYTVQTVEEMIENYLKGKVK